MQEERGAGTPPACKPQTRLDLLKTFITTKCQGRLDGFARGCRAGAPGTGNLTAGRGGQMAVRESLPTDAFLHPKKGVFRPSLRHLQAEVWQGLGSWLSCG